MALCQRIAKRVSQLLLLIARALITAAVGLDFMIGRRGLHDISSHAL